jgi:hypothetical protein
MRYTLGGVVVVGFVGLLGFVGCVGDTATPTDAGADSGGADTSSPPDGSDAAVDAAPPPTVVAIFAGGSYQGGNTTLGNGDRSCAIVAPAGGVWCWGDNQFGELGQGTSGTDGLSATEITKDTSDTPFADVEDLAIGGWHTCAKKKNGKVYCWGQDQSGAIGDNAVDPNGTKPPVTRPQPLALGSFVAMQGTAALAAGYGQSCAIDATGKANCWGWNGATQLGHSTTSDSACSWMYVSGTQCNGGPIAVIDNSPFTNANIAQMATGENVSCVRTAGANVFCFGDHSWVGSGAMSPAAIELMTDSAFTQPLTNVTKIAMGAKTLCALTTAQSVYCAGFDALGQTGQSAPAKYAHRPHLSRSRSSRRTGPTQARRPARKEAGLPLLDAADGPRPGLDRVGQATASSRPVRRRMTGRRTRWRSSGDLGRLAETLGEARGAPFVLHERGEHEAEYQKLSMFWKRFNDEGRQLLREVGPDHVVVEVEGVPDPNWFFCCTLTGWNERRGLSKLGGASSRRRAAGGRRRFVRARYSLPGRAVESPAVEEDELQILAVVERPLSLRSAPRAVERATRFCRLRIGPPFGLSGSSVVSRCGPKPTCRYWVA